MLSVLMIAGNETTLLTHDPPAMLFTGSANRDEAAFEHADTFNITRQGPRHTSFGRGRTASVRACTHGGERRLYRARGDSLRVCRATGDRLSSGLAALPLNVKPRLQRPVGTHTGA